LQSTVIWTVGMAFDASRDGHSLAMDATPKDGGDGAAPSPKDLLLASLAGCLGISVLSILQKMRMSPDSFVVHIDGTEGQEHPKVFTEITVTCKFSGQLSADRLLRAVHLSESRYCPVSAMLAQSCPVNTVVELNGERA
jgi:putative redox protein